MYCCIKFSMTHLRGHFCDSLDLFSIRFHAFVENGSIEDDLMVLYLTFPTVEYNISVAGYLH